jgi:hypothetical protein
MDTRPFGRPSHGQEDNIIMDLKEIGVGAYELLFGSR